MDLETGAFIFYIN